jgi:ATP-dependent Clp protease ATP-binding subunit ClpX
MIEGDRHDHEHCHDALEAIAESALKRKIGARGLQMSIEKPMLDVMYSRPHQKLRACVITREIVEAHDTRLSLLEKAGEERRQPPSLY